ncbi:MAG TPA: TIM barrel protein [Rectinemataceae bacterium]|nr:TIM barrel protein [Rectinemataceae bacterium]
MRFSLAHLTLLSCTPPELTRMAARLGYDFVSLRTIYMGLPNEPNYDLAANRDLLRETKRALADTGLGLHDIELARICDGTDPRRYLPAFEVAAELGCGQAIASVWTAERNYALDRFREICDLARPLGIRVNLEFMAFSELRTLVEALAFLRAAGSPNAGLLIDSLHFHCSQGSLAELDDVPRGLLDFVHICDGPAAVPATREGLIHRARYARQYLGQGGIDVAGLVNRLPELVYSIELPNPIQVEIHGREGHARLCLETARAYFAAHPRKAG